MSEDRIEAAILALVEARGAGKCICPSEAAREAFPESWNDHMRHVRNAAVHLARQGQIVILRKGKPVDPEDFKGVYRLALPESSE
ncbi:DUF3253 domain-containing protein [Maricaulaceae bacterium NA33B04]|nr:DUF3253 domain-containing protein [Maricaulaceae bacterium NA33B04]